MSLHEKQAVLADLVMLVARRLSGGLYICGRPGTGKTHLVLSTLKSNKISYRYQQGQANPLPLFDQIEESPDGIHVLDDTTELFKIPRGLQILKAMLGKQRDGSRIVTYHSGRLRRRVDFTGGLIAISNESKINDALKSRVGYVGYDLTDDEMNLLMDEVASQGHPNDHSNLTPAECNRCLAELRTIQQELANEQKPVRLDLHI